ncbi:MAG: heavy metal-associated domain-containing protein [bacterium]|nr:heavy metal-associated domain-containing protein [bacterium]
MSTSTYDVTGMTCGHCVSSVTEAVTELPEVVEAVVDLETGTLTVVGEIEPADIFAAVAEVGYRASLRP